MDTATGRYAVQWSDIIVLVKASHHCVCDIVVLVKHDIIVLMGWHHWVGEAWHHCVGEALHHWVGELTSLSRWSMTSLCWWSVIIALVMGDVIVLVKAWHHCVGWSVTLLSGSRLLSGSTEVLADSRRLPVWLHRRFAHRRRDEHR